MTTLDTAIRPALHNGTKPEEMIRTRWCETYSATAEEYDAALTKALSKVPPNSAVRG